ncbi:MAG: hypothetical protein B6D46_13050 [Polyangiaceae bacterium UTPRO1]|nr:MAG: hypothetical protein B6D46_13050 [Polyangiaceae bacterium UTPRO1]
MAHELRGSGGWPPAAAARAEAPTLAGERHERFGAAARALKPRVVGILRAVEHPHDAHADTYFFRNPA